MRDGTEGIQIVARVSRGIGSLHAQETQPGGAKHVIAIENVCAWPNVTLMPDRTIIASVHNQPSHGGMEGEIEDTSIVVVLLSLSAVTSGANPGRVASHIIGAIWEVVVDLACVQAAE